MSATTPAYHGWSTPSGVHRKAHLSRVVLQGHGLSRTDKPSILTRLADFSPRGAHAPYVHEWKALT